MLFFFHHYELPAILSQAQQLNPEDDLLADPINFLTDEAQIPIPPAEQPLQNNALPDNPQQNNALPDNPQQNNALLENPPQNNELPENSLQNNALSENSLRDSSSHNNALPINSSQNNVLYNIPSGNSALPNKSLQNCALPKSALQHNTKDSNALQSSALPTTLQHSLVSTSHHSGTASQSSTAENEGFEREASLPCGSQARTPTYQPAIHEPKSELTLEIIYIVGFISYLYFCVLFWVCLDVLLEEIGGE